MERAAACLAFALTGFAASAGEIVVSPGEVLDLTGCTAVTAECRIRCGREDNPFFASVFEHGDPTNPAAFRLSFNDSYRDRRLRGSWGTGRVDTGDFALDDGAFHHVALVMEAGRRLTLWLDGECCGAAAAPAAFGRLRFICGDFRGYVRDLRLTDRALEPSGFLPHVRPDDDKLPPLDPDPDPPGAVWKRPETTRRYLHGPLSERLLTLWRDGKVVFGEVQHRHDWGLSYKDQVSHGAWLVHGGAYEPFDFRLARNTIPADGTPLHGLVWRDGALEVELEACAPFGRRPTTFVRLKVSNRGEVRARGDYAVLLRTGKEKELLFSAPDVYRPFDSDPEQWRKLAVTWAPASDGLYRDGDRFVAFGGEGLVWDGRAGAVRWSPELAPGESRAIEFALGRGTPLTPGYESACARTVADWRREMKKMKLPPNVANDARKARMAENLLKQALQCMSLSAGDEEPILPRQGGLARYVWPYENMPVMAAFGLFGFGEYVERTIAYYFGYQAPDGKINAGRWDWACNTATCLGTFARFCLDTNNRACWVRYRGQAFKAFEWIRGCRRETAKDPGLIPGFFPPMRSSDWEERIQHWSGTDIFNLEGLRWYAAAAERYGDLAAKEIRDECEDYIETFRRTLAPFRAAAAGKAEFHVPLLPSGDDEILMKSFYPLVHYGFFAAEGLLTADEMVRMKTWMERRGLANGCGLYGFFPNVQGEPKSHRHHWYTSYGDYPWFVAWLKVGRKDLAEEIFEAQVKWSMTDEYYMGERYDDANPWYFPWSPNASASGRMLLMMREL